MTDPTTDPVTDRWRHAIARCAPVALALALTALAPGSARADGGDATASALFYEGRRLFDSGQIADACNKFEASMSLEPRLGVQLNLGDCYERLGRTASAWMIFSEAVVSARRLADPRERYARERVAALAPRLSRLVISPAIDSRATGLAVTRDGEVVPPVAYNVEVPVDPGEHVVEAMQPGRRAWSTLVTVGHDGELLRVTIPELEALPDAKAQPSFPPSAPPSPPPSAPSPAVAMTGRRRPPNTTWVAAGVAVAGVGVGTYFGLSARSGWNRARQGCDLSLRCSDWAYDAAARSRRHGMIANIGFAVGGAALATGLALYLISPRTSDRDIQIAASASPGGIGVTARGAF
jgi:hypothetical protein